MAVVPLSNYDLKTIHETEIVIEGHAHLLMQLGTGPDHNPVVWFHTGLNARMEVTQSESTIT